MSRVRWPLLILIICLPLILLAAGVRVPGLTPRESADPEPVPAGDYEIAWINTSTASAAWERFVAGAKRADKLVPGLQIDASRAFAGHTTAVPEVVLALPGRSGKLRIRWYKLSNQHKADDWIARLASRNPAPLAIVGGSTSDRARDLALALVKESKWHGDRPLLFLTNATAENVFLDKTVSLTDIYPGRTFRICFNNGQMAEAILDFVWQNPALRPQGVPRPAVFRVSWDDDPYSGDLLEQFTDSLPAILNRYGVVGEPLVFSSKIPFSVGGFATPNRAEEETAAYILREFRKLPPQRALLVIPTVAGPARRLLKTICESDPALARNLVAVNGDGMGANAVLRDGEYLWPMDTLQMPLVLFMHANPAGWDDELQEPNSTEEVLHSAELIRLIASSTLEPSPIRGADELAQRLVALNPPFFDAGGNRAGGTGEFVLVLKPERDADQRPMAGVEVWMRRRDRSWAPVKFWPLKPPP